MDKVLIRDLLARGVIGISERERSAPQDILINITLYTDTRRAAQSDDISDCVNYAVVTKKALALAESAQRFTVEALAEDIARLCMAEPGVQQVDIRVEKPGAVRFAASVGVEITRVA